MVGIRVNRKQAVTRSNQMRSIRQVLSALFLMSLLLTASSTIPARAQDADAAADPNGVEAVFRAAYDAINAGDAEGAMAYYASDAVSVALPAPPGTTGVMVGYDDILQVTKDLIAGNLQIEITDFHAFGDSAAMTALHSDDAFIALGVAPLEFTGTTTVQNGLIVQETWVIRPESFARFIAAIKSAENKALVQRLYDEVYNGQAPDILSELVAPDALADYQASVAEMQAAFPELTATVDRLLVEGDQVVAVLTFTGTPAGGEPVTWSQVDVHRLADGLLAETSHFGGPPAGAE
ncbi:MAG: nuclear transport factor 2 family protein [Caldilinea sp.]|nr:nuclear transport factor 2 family protein [Caldilinea sp.]